MAVAPRGISPFTPSRLVYSASGPIIRMAVYVGISIHRDSSRSDMSDFTWGIRELEKLTRPDLVEC